MLCKLDSENSNGPNFDPLSPKLALQLAAPHTWAASVIPPCVACAFAYAHQGSISVSLSIALLIICILMQSAVNTFNDYSDFKSGADTADDNVEVSDATLVYNNINPNSVLKLAVGFLVVALLLGVYCILRSGWICLLIGIVGAIVVVSNTLLHLGLSTGRFDLLFCGCREDLCFNG